MSAARNCYHYDVTVDKCLLLANSYWLTISYEKFHEELINAEYPLGQIPAYLADEGKLVYPYFPRHYSAERQKCHYQE